MVSRFLTILLFLSILSLISVITQPVEAITRVGNIKFGQEQAYQSPSQASRGVTFPYKTGSSQQLAAFVIDKERPTQKITITTDSVPQGDEFSISGSRMSGKQLKIDVSYSGGCKPHSFKLYWSGAYQESFPPQVRMRLVHSANNDACEKLVKEILVFDTQGLQPSVLRLTNNFGYSKSLDLTR